MLASIAKDIVIWVIMYNNRLTICFHQLLVALREAVIGLGQYLHFSFMSLSCRIFSGSSKWCSVFGSLGSFADAAISLEL